MAEPDKFGFPGPPDVIHGVPAGGTTGQLLAKTSGADFDDEWIDPPTGGGGGGGGAVPGIALKFETSTAASNPAAGKMRGNNATFKNSTHLYFNAVDQSSVDFTTYLQQWAERGGTIIITQGATLDAPMQSWAFVMSAYAYSGYSDVTCSAASIYPTGGGSLSADDDLTISFVP